MEPGLRVRMPLDGTSPVVCALLRALLWVAGSVAFVDPVTGLVSGATLFALSWGWFTLLQRTEGGPMWWFDFVVGLMVVVTASILIPLALTHA